MMRDKDRGIYNKYFVKRKNDATGKHNQCFFFVLDLDHDKHAQPALRAYIESCQKEYSILAQNLRKALEGGNSVSAKGS